MKKLIVLLVAMVFSVASVSAMTEAELKEKLTQAYEVNGTTFQATDSQKALIERYLNLYEVSSSDADYIYSKLQEGLNILKNSGKKDFKYLSKADKNRVIALVDDVAANTSIDCAVVGDELVVYEPVQPGTANKPVFYRGKLSTIDNEIARTSGNLIVAGLGLISVLGMALAFKKIKNA